MPHVSRLRREQTALAVIDMQDGFRPTIADFDAVAARIGTAVAAAQILRVPVVVTEQYPRGLKQTAREIVDRLADGYEAIEKLCFSACGAADFVSRLEQGSAKQVLLCGIEAHVCIMQTTLDLLERNFEVHLLTDCITSRVPESKEAAMQRLVQAGAVPSTLEMALFELMQKAGTPDFKAVQALIK